jgi:hypothetical protein
MSRSDDLGRFYELIDRLRSTAQFRNMIFGISLSINTMRRQGA